MLIRCNWLLKAIVVIAVHILTLGTATSADTVCAKPQDIMRSLNNTIANNPLFSGSVVVSCDNKIVAEAHKGFQNRETKILNSGATAYSIASVGKMMTAVAIQQLIEVGKISLEDTVVSLLPSLQPHIPTTITIEHLLMHRSGFSRIQASDEALDKVNSNHDQFLLMLSTGISSKGSGKFGYRNTNYITLGEIIETYSAQSYEEYIVEHIGNKLDWTGPVFARRSKQDKQGVRDATATPYLPVDFDTWWNSEDEIIGKSAAEYHHVAPETLATAGGGLFLTAADLARFLHSCDSR